MFSKARPLRTFESVTNQIEEVIYEKGLSAGSRLPSERMLQEMLGVSRNTLRESLRVLEHKGLIEVKTGNRGGIFVRESNTDQMTDSLAQFVKAHKISLGQMAIFRQDMESIIAERAAGKATPDNLQPIYRILERAENLATQGPEAWLEFMEADREIHLALADVANHPVHRFILETVHNNIHHDNILAYLPKSQEILDRCLADLKALIDAVASGDGPKAASIARKHVEFFNESMEDLARKEG